MSERSRAQAPGPSWVGLGTVHDHGPLQGAGSVLLIFLSQTHLTLVSRKEQGSTRLKKWLGVLWNPKVWSHFRAA